jgi:hypothetical protein
MGSLALHISVLLEYNLHIPTQEPFKSPSVCIKDVGNALRIQESKWNLSNEDFAFIIQYNHSFRIAIRATKEIM